MTESNTPVTQADADVAQAIVSGVRGYGVTFASPLEHSASILIARHRQAAEAEAGAREAALREALSNVRAWAASLTVCDMNEIVADNGITAGMVVGQEAGEQVRRIDRTLAKPASEGASDA